MRQWSDRIWIAEAPLRFYGVQFGTRMTVVQLADGGLFVHSPLEPVPELRAEIEALGPVRCVVSPNKLHHLFLGPFRQAFPSAQVFASPGLEKKRRDLYFDAALGDEAEPLWAADLDQTVVRGSRVMEEVVFFHAESRTLIVADLCEHFGPWSPRLTRLVARVGNMYAKPRMPPDWQLSFRNREATRASFQRILAWDFDRVILAHGELIERGARDTFRRAYAWALR
jgi:glyoxylase-like metal-dependent hydrolase (beta-lactamase superfamily II)